MRQARNECDSKDRTKTKKTVTTTCSFCHCSGASCRTEMADIEQTQKMIPFVTCEITFGQYVCELVLGVNVWVLETCLIVGLLPL